MKKLSRKDIEMLEVLATTTESDDKLAEYIHYHKKAVKAYKAFREAVVNGVEIDKVVEPVETKRKFKAGDKVRVLTTKNRLANTTLCEGEESVVAGYKEDDIAKWSARGGSSLRPVKVLDGERKKLLGDPHGYFEESSLELVEEKTPNELRADVIARARVCFSDWLQEIYPLYIGYTSRTDFRYVEVKLFDCAKSKSRGIAKCAPDDVFNEHISKAIALGRALGKDVSEFENAVQPSELVVGMVIRRNYFNSTDTYEEEIEKIEGEVLHYAGGRYDLRISDADNLTIIDDTNAQYGGVGVNQ